MWLGLNRAVDIYVGQTLAIVDIPGKGALVLEHPITLPMDKVLDRITDVLPKRSKVRITLSCGHCPAVELNLPAGVASWRERRALIEAWTATELNTEQSLLAIETDERHPAVAAAVSLSILETVRAWANKTDRSIASIRPLWSYVSEWAGSQLRGKEGLELQEPDGTTVIAGCRGAGIRAKTISADNGEQALEVNVRNCLVQFSLKRADVLRLGFGGTKGNSASHSPRPWVEHWF